MAQHLNTNEEFDVVTAECRALFVDKLKDYGAAWRILRPQSLTDQIFIKANRIRTLETTDALVDEGIKSELIGIVNYAIIGMIQLELGFAEHEDMTAEQAAEAYDRKMEETKALMKAKNHDYGEAWRGMRPESYTVMITFTLLVAFASALCCAEALTCSKVEMIMVHFSLASLFPAFARVTRSERLLT